MNKINFILLTTLTLALSSCFDSNKRTQTISSTLSSGTLHYNLEWKTESKQNYNHLFMPKTFTIDFNKNITNLNFSSMFGLINVDFIKQEAKDSIIIILDSFGQKNFSKATFKETYYINKIETIIDKDSVYTIGNLNSKKANIYYS